MKTTTWPHLQLQQSFYNQMVVNKSFQFRFDEIFYELVESYVGMEPELIFGEQYEKHISHPHFSLLRELEGKSDENHGLEHGEDEYEHHTNKTEIIHSHDVAFGVAGARSEMITSNFLRISAYLAKSTVTVKEDCIKYTGMSLLSQVGAIANLWAGITIVVVVEMVELLYRISLARRPDVSKVTKVQQTK